MKCGIMPVYRRATLSCDNKSTQCSDPSSGVHELLVLSACEVRASERNVPPSTKSEPSASYSAVHAQPSRSALPFPGPPTDSFLGVVTGVRSAVLGALRPTRAGDAHDVPYCIDAHEVPYSRGREDKLRRKC
jgi:hypothetical protein